MPSFIPGILASSMATTPSYPAGITPEVWLDASNAGSITLNGSTVSQWNDLGPNGYTFTQGTASYQPTLVSNGLNSKNTISWGGNDVLNSTAAESVWKFFNDGTKYLFCFVGKFSTQFGWLLITDAASGANAGGRIGWDTNGSLVNATVNAGESGTYSFFNQSSASSYPSNTWKNIGILTDPTNGTAASRSSIKINNGSSIANNTLTNNNANQNPASTWLLGSYLNDAITDRMVGEIAEIIVIKATDATDSNRSALYTYLNNKWGI